MPLLKRQEADQENPDLVLISRFVDFLPKLILYSSVLLAVVFVLFRIHTSAFRIIMAWKDKEIEKLYYAIGEVAEMLGENASLIRYWENQFDILKPKKNAKGDRLFTKSDIEILKIIHHLVKDKGYTLEGAKIQLKTKFEDEKKKFLLVEKLKKIRGFLTELKEQL